MNRLISKTAAVAFCAFLLSCGKDNDPACDLTSSLCSCDLRSTALASCVDYEGRKVSEATTNCSDSGGSLSTAGLCPAASRVGTCKSGLLGNYTHTRYYSDAVTHQAACTVAAMGTGFLGGIEWIAN